MIVWVVRDGGWVRYKREGECLACGDCCRKFNYRFSYADAQKKSVEEEGKVQWDDWEGWAVEDWDDEGTWTWWGPLEIIPLDKPKCKQFNAQTNECAKFGQEDWREICRKFPLRPEDLEGLPNCGFRFERLEA